MPAVTGPDGVSVRARARPAPRRRGATCRARPSARCLLSATRVAASSSIGLRRRRQSPGCVGVAHLARALPDGAQPQEIPRHHLSPRRRPAGCAIASTWLRDSAPQMDDAVRVRIRLAQRGVPSGAKRRPGVEGAGRACSARARQQPRCRGGAAPSTPPRKSARIAALRAYELLDEIGLDPEWRAAAGHRRPSQRG